jgi:hypothetical protein
VLFSTTPLLHESLFVDARALRNREAKEHESRGERLDSRAVAVRDYEVQMDRIEVECQNFLKTGRKDLKK